MSQLYNEFLNRRTSAVREKFCNRLIDGILFNDISNIRYLTGFTGSEGVLLLSAADARLLVDGRYITQAGAEVQGISIIQCANKMNGIERAAKELGLTKIGFETACMTVEMHQALTQMLPQTKFVALPDELRMLRACKDENEIDLMKKAAAIASGALVSLARDLKPGWTEQETALHLEMTARRSGAEHVAFETIVASGENAALPHASPSQRKIRQGDFVVVDFGVKYGGYCSDETCTFAIGELTRDQKNAYRCTLQAHDAAIAFISAGRVAADVDALVRRVLGAEYSRYFVHATGHGVGLEVHESPRLAPNSQDVLKAGMVVTVEPGLYYPGLWGIRIEDSVLVGENSCEIITKMNKELIIIE